MMGDKTKHLVRTGHDLASELKADCGAVDVRSVANLLTELASALDVQSARSDALAAELARYSMPAGEADQRMAESRAVRQALGFGQDADDVAPVDLVERINALAAALKSSEANDADARCHVAELEEKCAALAAELKQSKIDAECYKHGMEQSNKRLTEIAAENAALIGFDADEFSYNGPYQPDDAVLEKLKTPATDAWVNEQRAAGVDMVVKYHMERAKALKEVDRKGSFNHSNAALDAGAIAEQLRWGQV